VACIFCERLRDSFALYVVPQTIFTNSPIPEEVTTRCSSFFLRQVSLSDPVISRFGLPIVCQNPEQWDQTLITELMKQTDASGATPTKPWDEIKASLDNLPGASLREASRLVSQLSIAKLRAGWTDRYNRGASFYRVYRVSHQSKRLLDCVCKTCKSCYNCCGSTRLIAPTRNPLEREKRHNAVVTGSVLFTSMFDTNNSSHVVARHATFTLKVLIKINLYLRKETTIRYISALITRPAKGFSILHIILWGGCIHVFYKLSQWQTTVYDNPYCDQIKRYVASHVCPPFAFPRRNVVERYQPGLPGYWLDYQGSKRAVSGWVTDLEGE
jgi:hypothetical protein